MAGILSAIGTVLNLTEAVKTLGDEKMSDADKTRYLLERVHKGTLVQHSGDITKLLNKYIVTPTIICSNSLKDSEILYNLIQLQTDIFASYYAQAFKVLTNIDGVASSQALQLLSSDKQDPIKAGAALGIRFVDHFAPSRESLDSYSINILSTEAPGVKADMNLVNYYLRNPDGFEAEMKALGMQDRQISLFEKQLRNAPKNITIDQMIKAANLSKAQADALKARWQAHEAMEKVKGTKPTLKFNEPGKDSPDTYAVYERQIDISISGTESNTRNGMAAPDGADRHYTFIVPITIKASIIFTPYANIENVISPRKDDKAFWYRVNEWRAGGISFWELLTAKDLIQKYKENKLRDKENILSKLNQGGANSFLKGIANKDLQEGYDQFYNMVIITSEEREQLERYIGGKLAVDRYKDKFLAAASSMTITTVDNDYEKVVIQTKDIHGESIVPFKAIKKRKGDKDDLSEIFKAMMQSKAPVFA